MTSAVTDNQLSSLVLSFTHASWKLTAKRDISCVKQPSRVEVGSVYVFCIFVLTPRGPRRDPPWVIRSLEEGQVSSIAHNRP